MAYRRGLLVVLIISLAGCAGTHSQATRRPGRSTAKAVAGRIATGHVTGVPRVARWGLTAVSFVTADRGWVVRTDPSALLETTDGGITWRRLGTDLPPITHLSFVSDGTGWGTTPTGGVFHFTDGGRRWSRVALPWLATDVSFPDRNHGWLSLGPAGALARTINGGRTWSLTPKISVCRRLSVETEIAFTNPTHGYLVCLAEPGAGMERKWLFATTDGGETWTQTGVPVGGSIPSLGASPAGGVAMDATPDGISVQSAAGTRWRYPVTTDWGPTGIAWPARRTIYVALGRALVKSTDGGRGWRQILPISHEQPEGPTSFAEPADRLRGRSAPDRSATRAACWKRSMAAGRGCRSRGSRTASHTCAPRPEASPWRRCGARTS